MENDVIGYEDRYCRNVYTLSHLKEDRDVSEHAPKINAAKMHPACDNPGIPL